MASLPPSLQAALERDALVIAPTALAAASLRAAHDRRQRAAGLRVWQPANVLSWQQWLGSLWTGLILSGREGRLLLNTAQEELLWRELIVPSLDPASQASAPAFAELARSAFALAAGYNLTARLSSAAGAGAATEDTEQFARWAADFARTCGRHAYLPPAQLSAALRDHLARQAFTPPAELHLAGFAAGLPDLAPADAGLLEAIRRAGARLIEHPPVAAPPATRLTVRAANESEELRAVAHWLRAFFDDHLQAAPTGELPTVHLVLAGPQAASPPARATLDSIFREVLAPELNDIAADSSSAPWEHTAGRPLAEQPIVATLLRLFRGLARPLSLDDTTVLLLSPYLGPAPNRNAAAQLDAWSIRDRPPLRPELTFPELQRLVQRSPFGASTSAWLNPLVSRLSREADLDAPRTHAAWTSFLRDLADAVSWPGRQTLTPLEFAATQAWDHLLDSLAPLDFTGRRVPFTEALAALERQAQTATVSLPTHPPIRILSVTEAAALPCDVLVLAQATGAHWPPAARPHPLLPWSLQAAAGMPGAHPARDAARAERLTADLLATASHLLLTHAAEANDTPQSLAPLLQKLTWTEASPPWRALTAAGLLPAPAAPLVPEQVFDDAPLPPLPSLRVAGGATVLQLQAACGFRAFAELRLRSTEPRAPELGIDAGRAGSLLHHALDLFWQAIPSQSALRALPDSELDNHLTTAIEQAFARFPGDDDPWDRAYRELQMQRLFHLLKSWMSFETRRSPFTVLTREQDRQLTVGPLELQLRIDRMDAVETAEGEPGTVLIDYKTGLNARPAAWETDRPEEPQLPLYTLLSNPYPLRGLAFARIRRGQFAWAGLQAEPGLLGKSRVSPDLEERVDEWRGVLTRLAEEFAAGNHSVNPRSYPATCTHCGQHLLCRIDPNTLPAVSVEAGEDEELAEEPAYG